jgi:hypothetical protein
MSLMGRRPDIQNSGAAAASAKPASSPGRRRGEPASISRKTRKSARMATTPPSADKSASAVASAAVRLRADQMLDTRKSETRPSAM